MRGKWFWVIVLLAVISLLLSLFGPWSATQQSNKMGQSIQSALSANDVSGVNVEMNGNVATLSGELASQDMVSKAANIAGSTECETCKKKGELWHEVESKLTVKKQANKPVVASVSPYVFTAIKDDGGKVHLEGYVRNQDEKASVLSKAKAVYGDQLASTKIRIAPGAPDNNWGEVINVHLPELASLDYGRFVLEDNQILIEGEADTPQTRNAINEVTGSLTNRFAVYNGAANIRVPNAKAANVGHVNSQSICQDLLKTLKGDYRVSFATDSAEITGAHSFDLLNTLSSAVIQCKSFNVRVDGHTDSVGDAKYNQWLSEARANSVVAYLADGGVDLSRMQAVGNGESKPIATNDTAKGKAQNRRIEFTIVTSE